MIGFLSHLPSQNALPTGVYSDSFSFNFSIIVVFTKIRNNFNIYNMKYLKLFDSFNLIQEGNITFLETEEIFYPTYDYGLEFDSVNVGHYLSLGDKDIVEDHKQLSRPVYSGVSVRLKNKGIRIDDSFFSELQDCISHFESRCESDLSNIYFRTPDGYWFRNVDVLKSHLEQQRNLPFATDIERNPYRMLLFIDITFKFNDSVKTFWTTGEDGQIRNIQNR